ncbi:MAG: S9 family peptidase, partial [Chitinophagaceae bacterium]
MKKQLLIALLFLSGAAMAQEKFTPEKMWALGRTSAEGISTSGKTLYYSVKYIDWQTEKSTITHYQMPLTATGSTTETRVKDGYTVVQRDGDVWYATFEGNLYKGGNGQSWTPIFDGLKDAGELRISPDGKSIAYVKEVLVKPVNGSDLYKDLPNTTAKIYRTLNDRHWDTWEDGKYKHIFVAKLKNGAASTDIMEGEPYDCPQMPFGGDEDFRWTPDSKAVVYVCKKKYGTAYATSTNTDLYHYDLASKETTNWTAGRMGYDTNPIFSPDGLRMAWLSMRREGYEADKNDLIVMDVNTSAMVKINLTSVWDGTVDGFIWSRDSKSIYFNAAWRGTEQMFQVEVPANLMTRMIPYLRKVTAGKFDIAGIVGQSANGEIIVSRTDMNTAAELWAVSPSGAMRPLTHTNDASYSKIVPSETELRMVKTTDNKEMGVWVVYPPNFDPHKKYPTLLYCQGGPQSALTQFYSFRWNFALMAAQGYIIVAPNRRGMPGWGVQWNEEISGDWGGQPMKDYLSAIDAISEEPYVDKNRLGCIGASYGGYSVYMLAGIHNNRFKTFIAHDGVFDTKSMYGTTEEIWFTNWDGGGPYWKVPTPKAYTVFNPSNYVAKWNTPIMIVQGGIDYRVPIEQGLEALQAAQLRGIKSKLLYLPNENHWVLHPQNAIAWQREFFGWLKET